MKLYNSYILNKVAAYFFITTTILISLIWFSKATSFVRYVTEKGIKFSEFIYIFTLILPWLALLILPISTFIATIMIYNNMIANHEITIFKNSGLSKFDLVKPAILVAIFSCIICYIISLYLMPMTNKKLKLAKNNFERNYANIMISPGTFESLNKLTIYVKDRNNQDGLNGILIHDNRNPNYSATFTAENGNIVYSEDLVLLYLYNGTLQKFNFATRKSEILKFDNYMINLSDNSDGQNELRWRAKERYINELLYPEKETKASELIEYKIELHQRLTYPIFSFILSLIATAFVLRGQFSRRGNLINNIMAIACTVTFIASVMMLYNLMAKSAVAAVIGLYLDLILFIIFSLYLLTSNHKLINLRI